MPHTDVLRTTWREALKATAPRFIESPNDVVPDVEIIPASFIKQLEPREHNAGANEPVWQTLVLKDERSINVMFSNHWSEGDAFLANVFKNRLALAYGVGTNDLALAYISDVLPGFKMIANTQAAKPLEGTIVRAKHGGLIIVIDGDADAEAGTP
jgi:hypothetical protein